MIILVIKIESPTNKQREIDLWLFLWKARCFLCSINGLMSEKDSDLKKKNQKKNKKSQVSGLSTRLELFPNPYIDDLSIKNLRLIAWQAEFSDSV